jgi:acyl-CoA synthetase (AMP-forming)/AMP-acid ligase II
LFVVPPFRSETVVGLGGLIDECGISFMSSVPSVWRLALRTARAPEGGTLERVSCGSAPLSASLWTSVQHWAGTKDVMNAYGITETGSWLAGTTIAGFSPEDGLIGEAWGGVIRVLRSGSTDNPPGAAEECEPGETGHVWVNTPALMRGYFNRDDLTHQVVSQGWFVTGDIGLVDERGYLFLKGREREEINKGGMKIHPGDIDAVIERFEGVTDVCTFGYDDPLHGENVGVAMVLATQDERTLRRLYEWVVDHLARHKMPERWYVVEEIPRTSRGKINRETVARRCGTLAATDIRRIVRGSDV